MSDLIKRQDAIDACLNGFCACVSDCVDEIEKLPSAEQEQKTGKWISDGVEAFGITEFWNCSECEYPVIAATRYFPNCGARMECEEE